MHDLNEVLELLKKVKPDVDFTVENSLISDGILDSLDIAHTSVTSFLSGT